MSRRAVESVRARRLRQSPVLLAVCQRYLQRLALDEMLVLYVRNMHYSGWGAVAARVAEDTGNRWRTVVEQVAADKSVTGADKKTLVARLLAAKAGQIQEALRLFKATFPEFDAGEAKAWAEFEGRVVKQLKASFDLGKEEHSLADALGYFLTLESGGMFEVSVESLLEKSLQTLKEQLRGQDLSWQALHTATARLEFECRRQGVKFRPFHEVERGPVRGVVCRAPSATDKVVLGRLFVEERKRDALSGSYLSKTQQAILDEVPLGPGL